MKTVMFLPWVGKNYASGIKGKKILILGESQYCEEPSDCGGCFPNQVNDCNNFTNKVIIEHLNDGNKKLSSYTKLTRLFIGQNNDKEQIINFWDSIAFYNYIQSSVGSKARKRPSDEMWAEAIIPFNEVMEDLKPDFLLILGSDLWNHMPGKANGNDWPLCTTLKIDGHEDRVYYFGQEMKTKVLNIYHPSSTRFSYRFANLINAALEL